MSNTYNSAAAFTVPGIRATYQTNKASQANQAYQTPESDFNTLLSGQVSRKIEEALISVRQSLADSAPDVPNAVSLMEISAEAETVIQEVKLLLGDDEDAYGKLINRMLEVLKSMLSNSGDNDERSAMLLVADMLAYMRESANNTFTISQTETSEKVEIVISESKISGENESTAGLFIGTSKRNGFAASTPDEEDENGENTANPEIPVHIPVIPQVISENAVQAAQNTDIATALEAIQNVSSDAAGVQIATVTEAVSETPKEVSVAANVNSGAIAGATSDTTAGEATTATANSVIQTAQTPETPPINTNPSVQTEIFSDSRGGTNDNSTVLSYAVRTVSETETTEAFRGTKTALSNFSVTRSSDGETDIEATARNLLETVINTVKAQRENPVNPSVSDYVTEWEASLSPLPLANLKSKPEEMEQLLSSLTVEAETEADVPQTDFNLNLREIVLPKTTATENPEFSENPANTISSQIGNGILAKLSETENGLSEFEMTLAPEELGKITVKLTADGNKVSVEITAERPDTAALLQNRADGLNQSLRQNGVELQEYSVYQEPQQQEYYEGSQNGGRENPRESERENQRQTEEDGENENGLSFSQLIEAL